MSAVGYDALAEREKNTVGTAIAKVRRNKMLSQAALSKLLERHGVTVRIAAISKWEMGETVPNAYQLLALCHALEIENVLDAFGRDPVLNEAGREKLRDYRDDLIASGRYRPMPTAPEPLRYVEMPVSMLPASAGTGEFLDGDSFETVSFPASSIPEGAEFGVRVSGDSMEPVYNDGQIVWIQRCETLRPGEVGVFMYDGQGYLKVYGETPDGPVLVSYNRKYEPISVRPELELRIAGRVLN